MTEQKLKKKYCLVSGEVREILCVVEVDGTRDSIEFLVFQFSLIYIFTMSVVPTTNTIHCGTPL